MSRTEHEANVYINDRDLENLERLTYRKRWSTGLLDTMVGLAIALMGLCWLLDAVVVSATVPLLLTPIWAFARNRLILPRSGYSEPTEHRQEAERKLLSLSALLGAIILLQIIAVIAIGPTAAPFLTGMMGILAPGIPAFLLALLLFIGGILTDQQRADTYALLMVNAGLAGGLLGLAPGTIMMGCGAVILATGLSMLRRYLKQ